MAIAEIYMDYNATTPLNEAVRAAMLEDIAIFGNASSLHAFGRKAQSRIENARVAIGALIGGAASSLVFTSGGSESNNTVFQTMMQLASGHSPGAEGRTGIITSAIEHPCVLNSALFLQEQGYNVHILPVDSYGKLNMDALKAALEDAPLLVSIMMANNETGVIQDIKTIAALAKSAGAYVHTDAVQAVGKIPVNVQDLGVDYLTVSAHKIYGPKGIGALWVKPGAPLLPLIHGGHQENGLRAGTYNNLGIMGFGTAATIARDQIEAYSQAMAPLRNQLRDGLLEHIPNIHINGHPEDTLPNTLNVSFPGAEGESIMLAMDLEGIAVSTGSACASGSLEPSHVLLATGIEREVAHGSIRFSLGWGITQEHIAYVIATLPPIIARLRAMSTI